MKDMNDKNIKKSQYSGGVVYYKSLPAKQALYEDRI
jgi:hypothetical protein